VSLDPDHLYGTDPFDIDDVGSHHSGNAMKDLIRGLLWVGDYRGACECGRFAGSCDERFLLVA
jgi:hypothetical protein